VFSKWWHWIHQRAESPNNTSTILRFHTRNLYIWRHRYLAPLTFPCLINFEFPVNPQCGADDIVMTRPRHVAAGAPTFDRGHTPPSRNPPLLSSTSTAYKERGSRSNMRNNPTGPDQGPQVQRVVAKHRPRPTQDQLGGTIRQQK
jgi:hypothetical protein